MSAANTLSVNTVSSTATEQSYRQNMIKLLNRSVIFGCRGELHPSKLLQKGSLLLRQALCTGHLEGEIDVIKSYSRLRLLGQAACRLSKPCTKRN